MAKRGGPGVRRSGRQRSEFEAAGGVDEDRRGVSLTATFDSDFTDCSFTLLAGTASVLRIRLLSTGWQRMF